MKTLVIIFLKDLLRNKMLGLMVVLVPVIFYPLMYWGITQFLMIKAGLADSRETVLEYNIDAPEFAQLEDSLSAINNLKLTRSQTIGRDSGILSILVTEKNNLPRYEVFIDSSSSEQKEMYGKIEKKLLSYFDLKVNELAGSKNFPPEYFRVYNIEAENIDGTDEVIVKILSLLIPLFSVMSILGSCVAASVELTAGHSEDRTVETTLTLPEERKNILIAKFITVTLYGMLAGILNFTFLLAFMIQIFRTFFSQVDLGMSGFQWSGVLNFGNFAMSFVSLLLTAFFVSLIFVTAAGFASKRKEGNVLVSPFMALITYLPLVIVIPAIEPGILIAMTPVLNVAFSMKLLIASDIDTVFIIQSIFFSFLWTVLIYRYLLPFLLEEEVLLGYSTGSLTKKIKLKLGKWKKK